MKKLLKTLRGFLVVVCLCVGANGAWATTETFGASKNTTANSAITGTSVNISGTSNPSGTYGYAIFNSKKDKGLKLRTSVPLTFNVKSGYVVKKITMYACQNNTGTMTCDGYTFDGITRTFDSPISIPANVNSADQTYATITTDEIVVGSSVSFNFTNPETGNQQIYAFIEVEYESSAGTLKLFEDFGGDTYNVTWGKDASGTGFLMPSISNGKLTIANGSASGDRTSYILFGDKKVTGSARLKFDMAINASGWTDKNNTFSIYPDNQTTRNPTATNHVFKVVQDYNGYITINGEKLNTDTKYSNTTLTYDVYLNKASDSASVAVWNGSTKIKSFKLSTTATGIGTMHMIYHKNYGSYSIDNISLYSLTNPALTLSNTEKSIYVEDNGTVTLSDITGDISVTSDDTDVATVSYSDGTITINGVAAGNATIIVACENDGLTIYRTIAVTVLGYSAKYTVAKAEYDTKVENLDADGQTYWTANVTDPVSVTTASEYSTAIADLPTTYIAAVKAQTTKGCDMTEAMPTGNAGWTCDQGNGPASLGETGATESYSDGTNNAVFAAGNIMSQTISGLPNGYYKVQFYGVVNAANSVSTVSGSDLVQAYANATDLNIDVVLQNTCTPTDYLRTIEAQVTDGTLTYGLKAKEGVEDAGNWAVAKIYKLTYLGADKNTYTINAVADETTIKELATGTQWASDDYGVYIPKVILYNSKYYVLDDGDNENLDRYYASYTMGASNETKEINYTLDEAIVAYTEGEGSGYRNVSGFNNPAYSNGDYVNFIITGSGIATNARNRGFGLGTLPAGAYQLVVYVVNTTKKRAVAIRNTSDYTDPIVYVSNSNQITGELTANFTLTGSTTLIVNGANDANNANKSYQIEDLDYVLIRKIGELATIGSTGWSTFASPYALNLSSMTASEGSVKAYYASSIGASSVTMTSTESSAVAGGEGLMLKGTPSATITIPVVASGSAISGNKLVGVTSNQTFTKDTENYANFYVLSINGSGNAEFQNLKNYLDAGNSVTINAGKAYLDATGAAAARLSIVFDDETTGISEELRVKSEEFASAPTYNLQGQRVAQPTKGMYIVNGKKVVIK